MYIDSRLNAGYGPYVIAKKLGLKGIDEAATRDVIAGYIETEQFDVVLRAAELIRAVDHDDYKAQNRALRRLVSRGYDYQTAREAIAGCLDDDYVS